MLRDTEAGQVFQSCAKIQIGNGLDGLFWRDKWIDGLTVAEISPLVVMQVPTRIKNKRMATEALPDHGWVEDIQGTPTIEGCAQCARLWVTLKAWIPQKFTQLRSGSGAYSAKAMYVILCQERKRFSLASPIWRPFAPLKCKIFGWLAVQYRLWTSDQRQRHELQEWTDDCFTCLQEVDTVDHVLVRCSYARVVWHRCLGRARLLIPEKLGDNNLETWWSGSRKLVRKEDRRKFDFLGILTAWMIWKQRNARVFGSRRDQCGTVRLTDRIHDEFQMLESARVGGSENLARE
jgi:hypothetical protein